MMRLLLILALPLAGCASVHPGLDRTRSHLDYDAAAYLAYRCASYLGGEVTWIRGTGSMGDAFYAGQWVVLDRDWAGIQPGYIISFDHKGRRMIHRAIRFQDGQWFTNGDNTCAPIWVREKDYNGTLVAKFYHRSE